MFARYLTLVFALLIFAAIAPPAAQALTCADTAVEARGEQSRFMWSAKGKASANWRSKVRRTPGLGDAYANWARAQNTDERCLTGPAGTLCIFTGTPCVP
jgi:hypothetical protein